MKLRMFLQPHMTTDRLRWTAESRTQSVRNANLVTEILEHNYNVHVGLRVVAVAAIL